jgi:hypothetical protein
VAITRSQRLQVENALTHLSSFYLQCVPLELGLDAISHRAVGFTFSILSSLVRGYQLLISQPRITDRTLLCLLRCLPQVGHSFARARQLLSYLALAALSGHRSGQSLPGLCHIGTLHNCLSSQQLELHLQLIYIHLLRLDDHSLLRSFAPQRLLSLDRFRMRLPLRIHSPCQQVVTLHQVGYSSIMVYLPPHIASHHNSLGFVS